MVGRRFFHLLGRLWLYAQFKVQRLNCDLSQGWMLNLNLLWIRNCRLRGVEGSGVMVGFWAKGLMVALVKSE